MRLAVSDTAWNTDEERTIAGLLRHYRVDAVDITSAKYFPEPEIARHAEILKIKYRWAQWGVSITGIHTLLSSEGKMNMFGDPDSQRRMLERLDAVCNIGAELGVTRLILGASPDLGYPEMAVTELTDTAVSFFGNASN